VLTKDFCLLTALRLVLQADNTLPVEQRRNYKGVGDAMVSNSRHVHPVRGGWLHLGLSAHYVFEQEWHRLPG
jgi:hypothetical protein